jgi:hypothetical protein
MDDCEISKGAIIADGDSMVTSSPWAISSYGDSIRMQGYVDIGDGNIEK